MGFYIINTFYRIKDVVFNNGWDVFDYEEAKCKAKKIAQKFHPEGKLIEFDEILHKSIRYPTPLFFTYCVYNIFYPYVIVVLRGTTFDGCLIKDYKYTAQLPPIIPFDTYNGKLENKEYLSMNICNKIVVLCSMDPYLNFYSTGMKMCFGFLEYQGFSSYLCRFIEPGVKTGKLVHMRGPCDTGIWKFNGYECTDVYIRSATSEELIQAVKQLENGTIIIEDMLCSMAGIMNILSPYIKDMPSKKIHDNRRPYLPTPDNCCILLLNV